MASQTAAYLSCPLNRRICTCPHFFLYLAAERDSAIAEARKYQEPGQEIWVLQYQIDNVIRIADLVAPAARSDAFRDLSLPAMFAGLLWCDGLIQQGNHQIVKREYTLAQFVANCATETGINGFKVNSKLHGGTNLVLFTWDDLAVRPIGEPEFGEAAK